MVFIKTVYVSRFPPKTAIVHLRPAISSCSPEEIKKPNPSPDLHYFEMYWYSKMVGGLQKNVLRLLYPDYQTACEEYEKTFQHMFGNTEGWIDEYYARRLKKRMKQNVQTEIL